MNYWEEEAHFGNVVELVWRWRVWLVRAYLALPRRDPRLSQWAVDDAADGLHPLSFQEGAVVSLDDVDWHLAITNLREDAGRRIQHFSGEGFKDLLVSYSYFRYLELNVGRQTSEVRTIRIRVKKKKKKE